MKTTEIHKDLGEEIISKLEKLNEDLGKIFEKGGDKDGWDE